MFKMRTDLISESQEETMTEQDTTAIMDIKTFSPPTTAEHHHGFLFQGERSPPNAKTSSIVRFVPNESNLSFMNLNSLSPYPSSIMTTIAPPSIFNNDRTNELQKMNGSPPPPPPHATTLPRRIRIKQSPVLELVCLKYGTTVKSSNTLVSEGRKSVHILSFGSIDSASCFLPEVPTSSFRNSGNGKSETPTTAHTSMVIPNGWKVAAYIHGELWIAEVSYDHNRERTAQYQFYKLDDQGAIAEGSGWQRTPSAAFNASTISRKNDKPLRHNGKLFVGVHYEAPQARLREHFATKREQFSPELRVLVDAWLDNKELPVREITVKDLQQPLRETRKRLDSPAGIDELGIGLGTKLMKMDALSAGLMAPPPSISPSRPAPFQPHATTLSDILNWNHFTLPPPALSLPMPSTTFPVPSMNGLSAIELYQLIALSQPHVTYDALQDAVRCAPFTNWSGNGEQRIQKEDFVEFVEQVDKACLDLLKHGREQHISALQGLKDFPRMQAFFDATSRTTSQQKAVGFVQHQLKKYLVLHGELTFFQNEEQFTRCLTGLPLANELHLIL